MALKNKIALNDDVDDGLVRTPRANRGLQQILGQFETLTDALDYAARGATGFNFYSGRGALERVLPFSELKRQAQATARRFCSLGLSRGDRVAIVAETGAEFMISFFACQYAGLIPCPMPYSMHIGGRDSYIERVAGMLKAAQACVVITPDALLEQIGDGAHSTSVRSVVTHTQLQAMPESAAHLKPFGADEAAYIQYSSGSTSAPKGVLISQKAICANARSLLCDGLKITPQDRAFSWLPLYHDMGLVGFCLAPMMGQVAVDYLSTTAFARRPALWLRLMSENRSTICYSPSFGYDLAARRVSNEAAQLNLSQWRVAGIGGDMVRADVLAQFARVLSPSGFKAEAFLPSYGMAEATLAISISATSRPLRVDHVERAAYKTSQKILPAPLGMAPEKVRSFVLCGKPLPGHEVIICNDKGSHLGEREVGRILVRGPSLMSGYYCDADATHTVVDERGFLDTGDMGYWLDGELVITGRAKDLILHNGRNVWPQDIEWAAEHIAPLKSGDVAAFSIENDDTLHDDIVVLVECRLSGSDACEGLRRNVSAAIHHSAGVECTIILVAPKTLPFTSSGKLSRAGAKQQYLAGEINDINQALFLAAAE